MCALCYERAWYAKLGGSQAIKFLFERMSLRWVLEQQFVFLKALLFVMMDLTGEVCRATPFQMGNYYNIIILSHHLIFLNKVLFFVILTVYSVTRI